MRKFRREGRGLHWTHGGGAVVREPRPARPYKEVVPDGGSALVPQASQPEPEVVPGLGTAYSMVDLPVIPPSTNGLYRQAWIPNLTETTLLSIAGDLASRRTSWATVVRRLRGRRVKTKKYKQFLTTAALFMRSGLPVLEAPVEILVTIYGGRGWMESADVGNRIKAVEDALVDAGRLEDDNCRIVVKVGARYVGRVEQLEAAGIRPTKAAQGKLYARTVVEIWSAAS